MHTRNTSVPEKNMNETPVVFFMWVSMSAPTVAKSDLHRPHANISEGFSRVNTKNASVSSDDRRGALHIA